VQDRIEKERREKAGFKNIDECATVIISAYLASECCV
jgi:hypothetical protein